MTASFMLNGAAVALHDAEPTESLLRWLRRQRLAGTKEGCGDGDCGACTVALAAAGPDGAPRWQAVNSCLLPMGALAGREVRTVESLEQGGLLHPVQQAMVDCAGSQCGYCTPGFVMSLFVAQSNGADYEDAIEGNLCRCTGYRPIREAAARLSDARQSLAVSLPSPGSRAGALRPHPEQGPTGSPRTAVASLDRFFTPSTLDEAIALKREHPQAAWIAGGTDLGVELSRGRNVAPAFIALDRVPELDLVEVRTDAVRIGAGVPLTRIERELHGLYPSLDEMLHWFAARQVRNRATLGGNLGSASPIGDLLPVLLALDATVHLAAPQGTRGLPIDGFFLDYRKTQRAPDELIAAVTIPRRAGRLDASYKVAKRQTDDISIVAAAFALERDAQGRVAQARLAYGGVAAIPKRAVAVERFLAGKALDEVTVALAAQQLREAFAPLSDHRADADYRRALCGSLFAKFVAERAS
jgi:xanthine dehydrogenase small subunit